MDTSDRLTKLNSEADFKKLNPAHLDYMKKIEKMNLKRVNDLKKTKFRNRTTGFMLSAAVLGIYGYSIFAVKQEKFLDELDEPPK